MSFKTTAIAGILCLPVTLSAQDKPVTITGTIARLQTPAKVFLFYHAYQQVHIDSTEIKNGRFYMKANVSDETTAYLSVVRNGEKNTMQHSDGLSLILSKGMTIQLQASDSISNATISKSPINEKYIGFNRDFQQTLKKISGQYQQGKMQTGDKQEPVDMLTAQLAAREQMLIRFIRENPDSYASLVLLDDVLHPIDEAGKYIPIFEILSGRLQGSELGLDLKKRLETALRVDIGAMAPDFSAKTPDNQVVRLSDYHGKYVLLDFWASWCGPCRTENPNVLKAYNQYKDKGMVVLGLSCNTERTRQAWMKAIQEDGMPWTQVIVGSFDKEIPRLYCVTAIPQNFLIDPNGKIIAKDLRGEALQAMLSQVFGN